MERRLEEGCVGDSPAVGGRAVGGQELSGRRERGRPRSRRVTGTLSRADLAQCVKTLGCQLFFFFSCVWGLSQDRYLWSYSETLGLLQPVTEQPSLRASWRR